MKRGLIQLGEVWGQISEKYRKFKQIKKKPIISIREKLNMYHIKHMKSLLTWKQMLI